jgi:5-(carboxyamino)imidazole ribonucleotide mutase
MRWYNLRGMPLLSVVMGSESDKAFFDPIFPLLDSLGISYELKVISAHRHPEGVREYGLSARDRGVEVIIAGAGMAAHLPGVIASWTTIPVIGVPLPQSEFKGIDSLLSIVEMPSGVPVACVAIGGVKNAALLAAQMLGLKYEGVRKAYEKYRKELK